MSASTAYVPRTMRSKIIIERCTVTRNASGEEIPVWETISTQWANMRYLAGYGHEKTDAHRETASQEVEFVFRKPMTVDITEKDRITYKGDHYDITQIQPIGYNHYLTVITEYRR